MKNKIALGVFALALIALSVLSTIDSTTQNTDQPPQISFQVDALKGSLQIGNEIGCYLNSHRFSADDLENYDYKSKSGDRTPIAAGINMYFSPTDQTVQQLIENIIPQGQVFIAHYNPVENPTNQFSTYPGSIANPAKYTLPANQGFFIISCEKTSAYNLKTHQDHAEQLPADFPTNIGTNWILMSVPRNFDHKKFNVSSLWPQRDSQYVDFSGAAPVVTAFTEALNLNEMYNFSAAPNKMAWVKLSPAVQSAPPEVPDIIETLPDAKTIETIPRQQEIDIIETFPDRDLINPTPNAGEENVIPQKTFPQPNLDAQEPEEEQEAMPSYLPERGQTYYLNNQNEEPEEEEQDNSPELKDYEKFQYNPNPRSQLNFQVGNPTLNYVEMDQPEEEQEFEDVCDPDNPRRAEQCI